jgi:hypothetical protein
MSYLTKAINKLKPTAEFSFNNDDYSTVNWDVLEGNAPTQNEIDIAIQQIKADELAAKAAAEAKLAALGLTTKDLKALGLGAN